MSGSAPTNNSAVDFEKQQAAQAQQQEAARQARLTAGTNMINQILIFRRRRPLRPAIMTGRRFKRRPAVMRQRRLACRLVIPRRIRTLRKDITQILGSRPTPRAAATRASAAGHIRRWRRE
jgi:hypothetical protein